jgi:hypothetical protein
MKIAWLVWFDEQSQLDGERPELWTNEPDGWRCSIQIVYAEIAE